MINLGQTGITSIYIGDAQVTKVFLYTDLVWSSTPVIRNNEIRYIASSQVTPYDTTAFGATYLPNESTFDASTGEGVLKFDNDVTSIGDRALYNCGGLTSITIPNSVTSIGESAFGSCSGLTSVTLPDSVTSIGNNAFNGCNSLTSVTIPDSVTSIGNNTFDGCSNLTSVDIPYSVTIIGEKAFFDCSGLTSIKCKTTTPPICGASAFDNTNDCPIYVIEQLVDTYKSAEGWSAYESRIVGYGEIHYTSTSQVTPYKSDVFGANYLPEESTFDLTTGEGVLKFDGIVTSIGNNAFDGCNSLTSVTIPNSVTRIGVRAFKNCTGLTSVTIGNSVTSIGNYAFDGCTGLTKVNIADIAAWCNINFGDNPLSYAKHLYVNDVEVTNLVIPEGVTRIGNYAFKNCTGLTSVTIGNSVTSIGKGAFFYCSGLTSVTIGNSVTNIGYEAFAHCSGLTSVTIPDSVTSIGSYAFHVSTRLTSVTIGNGVTRIGNSAFEDCTSLTSVTCKATTPPICGASAFYNYNLSTYPIYVPYQSVDNYKSSWSAYASRIVGYYGDNV